MCTSFKSAARHPRRLGAAQNHSPRAPQQVSIMPVLGAGERGRKEAKGTDVSFTPHPSLAEKTWPRSAGSVHALAPRPIMLFWGYD